MNRSRFMSLPRPLPPARWPGARPAALAPAPAPAMEPLGPPAAGPDDLPGRAAPIRPDRRGCARIPVLRLGLTLAPGQAGVLTEAVLARVTCNRTVGTVVLELGAGSEIDAAACDALHALHDRLRGLGTGLRLVAGSMHVRDGLRHGGLTHRLGSEAIHPSLRAAVLATYAGLPGPGLVTGDVREALAAPAEPLGLPLRLSGLPAWPGA